MAQDDNPADRYNHRSASERDRERPVGQLPDALNGVAVDSNDTQRGEIEHFDAATEQEGARRGLGDGGSARAGGGGAPDNGAGDPGGTLGTDGSRREQDQ